MVEEKRLRDKNDILDKRSLQWCQNTNEDFSETNLKPMISTNTICLSSLIMEQARKLTIGLNYMEGMQNRLEVFLYSSGKMLYRFLESVLSAARVCPGAFFLSLFIVSKLTERDI